MSPRGQHQTLQLLLIDDDEDLRASMSEALEGAGFLVTLAANGREAFARLSATEALPDVILLDLLMPVMNGWQFCEERKKDPVLAAIPIIAMSAAVSKDPWSPYYLDVNDFVAKPIELDDLFAKLEGYTEQHVNLVDPERRRPGRGT
jgi:CheY-like chemotaxis protein